TAALTVLGADVLASSGAHSVFEVLTFVPGISLTSGAMRGGSTLALIRGGDPNYTSMLIDGVLVNDGTDQLGGTFNLEALPADAIERIEVVRGPLSSVYGSSGLAGAIQVITRRREGPLQAGARLTVGAADLYRVGAFLGAGEAAQDFSLHVLTEGEQGRIAHESFGLHHLQSRYRRELGQRQSLRLHGRFAAWRGDDYPDASGGPVFGDGELRRSDHQEIGLGGRWVRAGSQGRWQRLDATLYRHDLDRSSPAILPLVPAATEDTRLTRGRIGWAAGLPGSHGAWSFGVELERERAENRSLLRLPQFLGGDVQGDYDVERASAGIYSEWIRQQGPYTWEVGLRADLPEGDGVEVSPRLGFAYAPGSGSTRLVASAGRAFKLPSFFALSSPSALGGNPDLAPEISIGGDLGVEQSFAEGRTRLGLRFFVQEYEDLVDFDFETFSNVNRASVDARGLEGTLEWRPGPAWLLAANVTWQEVEDADTQMPLRHRPRWAGAVRATWRGLAHRGLDFHADLRFSSSRSDAQLPVPDRRQVGGYQLLGLAAHWHISPAWQLSARLDNLSDEDYEALIGFPGPSRSARMTFSWRSRSARHGDRRGQR
ncbi:MAG: TonB-dependent receptor, partial [Holophagales bacterium]|nr:TonB-dependent receptor [Holophagales bacterium]